MGYIDRAFIILYTAMISLFICVMVAGFVGLMAAMVMIPITSALDILLRTIGISIVGDSIFYLIPGGGALAFLLTLYYIGREIWKKWYGALTHPPETTRSEPRPIQDPPLTPDKEDAEPDNVVYLSSRDDDTSSPDGTA